ncbi:MAG: hypothetical protein WDA72_09495 [Desulfomonilia bacterium]|jgi:hypothetical protein|nr:DUF1573 domain-containing protein [Deltaproteobacteria bacterium]MDX9760509.1 hypothetical protein [Desulfomonilia bacterium]HPW68887.1 hypothetical protein [Deltaproteobacteria bacterium]
MKRFLVSGGILAFSVLVLFPLTALCAARAELQNPVFDAGEIPQGQDLVHEFLLKNAGDEPLVFKARPC